MRISQVISGVIVLLVIVFLAMIPWVDGFMFKRNYYYFIKALRVNKNVDIKIVEYHQGWFNSTAKLSIQPKDVGQPMPYMVPILLDQAISHGPFTHDVNQDKWVFALAVIQSKMHLPSNIETFLLGKPNSNGILESDAVVTLSGDYLTQFKTPVFNINGAIWQGLTGKMNFYIRGHRLQKMTTDMTIGAVFAKTLLGSVVTREAFIQYDISPDTRGLWDGTYHFTAPELTFSDGRNVLSIKNINTAYLFGVTPANLYNANVQFSVGQLVTPQLEANQSYFNLSFENMNVQGLLNLIKKVRSLRNAANTSEQAQQTLAIIPQVITPTTLVKEDTAINTSYGRVLVNAQIGWPLAVKTINDVVKEAIGKSDVRISISLVNQLITLLATHEASNTPQNTMQQPTEDNLLKQIDNWANQNKIDLSIGIQLKDLVQTHLSPAVFSKNVEQFVKLKQISEDIASQLIMGYTAERNAPPTQTAVPQPPSPEAQLKEQLNSLIQQGLIIQDKTDYVTSITLEQGVIKANGHEVQRLM